MPQNSVECPLTIGRLAVSSHTFKLACIEYLSNLTTPSDWHNQLLILRSMLHWESGYSTLDNRVISSTSRDIYTVLTKLYLILSYRKVLALTNHLMSGIAHRDWSKPSNSVSPKEQPSLIGKVVVLARNPSVVIHQARAIIMFIFSLFT